MILERAMNSPWLTNQYLVAGGPGGQAFFVDAGGPLEPLLEKVAEHDLRPTHVLLTHHHGDHVVELDAIVERFPGIEVLIHPAERDAVPQATGDLLPDQELEIGGVSVHAIHTPGHTNGMLSLLVDGTDVFTGDTLFKNSVGGVRAPGSTSYADLKRSVMDVLLALPGETIVRPGHTDPTTVADELEHNAFVRVWRGLDPEGTQACTALGEPATLVLLGDDYDGGHKAWVRWEDGRDDIVPGSKVEVGEA
jgi:glyoxylase-like metal-dependent hydrolase (beta-lactamase superfamily II)